MDDGMSSAAGVSHWRERLSTVVQDAAGRYRALGAAPDARRLLAAAAASYIGSEFNFIALIALSYQITGSALGVGGMLTAAALPRLLAQGPAGALVDRFPGPRLLVLTQCLLALIAAGYLLLLVTPNLWLLYGLIVAAGFVRTVDTPAFEVRLMTLVPPPQRGAANALNVLALSTSGLVGPLLGGIVLGLWGAGPLFVVNSLSFLAVAAVVGAMRPSSVTPSPFEPETQDEADASTPAELGYLALVRRPAVALYAILTFTSSLLSVALLAMLVVRSHALGLGDSGAGLFIAVSAVGALVGGVVAGGVRYDGPRAFTITALATGVGTAAIVLFGLAGSAAVACAALLLLGLSGPFETVAAVTGFQNGLPVGVYGRAFSLFLWTGAAGALVGGLVGPALSELAGVGSSLVLLAIPDALLAIAFGLGAGQGHWRRQRAAVVTAML